MSRYRIAWRLFGFEPQMRYHTLLGEKWVPLNPDGYWADEDCYSTGVITKRSKMSLRAARRALLRAKHINEEARPILVGEAAP